MLVPELRPGDVVVMDNLGSHKGIGIREAWLPLLLASAVMFTPVQWQNLLWPICCETFMPAMFLLFSLLVAFKPWPWWARGLVGGLLASCGMLSFASGVLLWVLPLAVYLVTFILTFSSERMYEPTLYTVTLVLAAFAGWYVLRPMTITIQVSAGQRRTG